MGQYIHYTDEQKLRAGEVDLERFLLSQGEELIRSGPEKRLKRDHSVTVRGNEWYDHAIKEGGGPVSFVQRFYGLSYPEAMSMLLGGEQGQPFQKAEPRQEAPHKPFQLPSANSDMRRVYAYLMQQRLISRDVLTTFAKAGLIYEDAEHHNAVFVGNDEHGVARHAHKRSVNSFGKTFRINVEGCQPQYSFHWNGSSEEDTTKYAIVSLLLQNLYREILAVADENGGQLKNRVVFYCDELGTIPPIDSLELMFSASRSRRLMLVPIVQSITGQLQKNYGKEGSEIIVDNCQLNIFGGFAPASQTAEEMSKALGNRTVMSGSVSVGKDKSQTLQMVERPLMTPDELKSMSKGQFIVMKTGMHPMQVTLRLFLDWGITFGKPYEVPEQVQRPVAYASRKELEKAIYKSTHPEQELKAAPPIEAEVAPESDLRQWARCKEQQKIVLEEG